MITNFEEITKPLSDEEKKMIKVLIAGFNCHKKDDPIKAPEILNAINSQKKKYDLVIDLTGARLRKLTNFIRCKSIIPLIATNDGYYVSYDKTEIIKQIQSLRERANAILESAKGLEKFIQ